MFGGFRIIIRQALRRHGFQIDARCISQTGTITVNISRSDFLFRYPMSGYDGNIFGSFLVNIYIPVVAGSAGFCDSRMYIVFKRDIALESNL